MEYCGVLLGGVIESATGNYARLPLNMWTHLALTRSKNIWNLYKNGALVGRGIRSPKITSGKVQIGKGFVGRMDEVKVWRKVLTPDELRSSMFQILQGNEQSLLLYYVMDKGYRSGDTILVNKVFGATKSEDAAVVSNGYRPIFVANVLQLHLVPSPKFALYSFPSHMQFFSRDSNSYAPITFDGSLEENDYDSVVLKIYKNDLLIARRSYAAQYVGSSSHFHFEEIIHAELSQYTYSLFAVKGNSEYLIAEAADLVAGDAFYVGGQSNAHPAIDWYSNVSPFSRTFGVQTPNMNFDQYDPADTSWGYGNAHGFGEFFGGPYLVGVWASRLQGKIYSSYGIPTCIINGAAGGSTIEQNLPNDTSHLDLTTVYGKALYRSFKSGMQKKYRAIFWYQGEYNSVDGYYQNFQTLYNAWLRDYAQKDHEDIIKKIYLFQIRPGCIPGERKALRELQRTLPDSLKRIEVMSTCGTSGHIECHFDAFGYWHIADNIYRLVARDFYGSSDTIDIDPPNITKVMFGDSINTKIILVFGHARRGLYLTPDTVVNRKLMRLVDYFYLDSISGNVRSVVVSGDTLKLQLTAPTNAKTISYLPDETYDNDSSIYEGPWIINQRDIGALSFNNVPILPFTLDTNQSSIVTKHSLTSIGMQCNPNPASRILTVKCEVGQNKFLRLELLDLLGKTVLTLEKGIIQSEEYQHTYDISSLFPGEYILRMIAGSEIRWQKVVLF